jgi:hypothetical protein
MHIMSEPIYQRPDDDRVARRDVTFVFNGWRPIEIEEGHTMLTAPCDKDATHVHATFVFRGDRPYAVLFAGVEQPFESIPRGRLMGL